MPQTDWLKRAQQREQRGVFLPRMHPHKAAQALRRRNRFLLDRMLKLEAEGKHASFFSFDAEESAALETAIYHLLEIFERELRERDGVPGDYSQFAR